MCMILIHFISWITVFCNLLVLYPNQTQCMFLTFRKVEQVAEEADSLKESLDKYFLRHQKRMIEAKERAELLGRAVCSLSFFLSIDNWYSHLSFSWPCHGFLYIVEWGLCSCFENIWWGSTSNAVCAQFIYDARRSLFKGSGHPDQICWSERPLEGIFICAVDFLIVSFIIFYPIFD